MDPSLVTERGLLCDRMIEQVEEKEQYPWIAVPDDLMEKIASRVAELSEEEKADPKSHPLEAGPRYQTKESKGNENLVTNETTSGSPWSEENSSKFILRKNGYIIKDKLVIPPNPLPETFLFSGETMSRIVLRKLGYTFTDEITPEETDIHEDNNFV
uniref:uncharacterized protein LOC122604598 n=1 Tax=Erigeron canadensis TaxID=72917 RepID=UPI001CB9415C|nr:uncharacterized protein LOC122604598 [Erigeron canadensis]